MNVGVVFVVLMAIGIGVGTFGIYNFEKKRYSVVSYVIGVVMTIPALFFGFDELAVLSIVTLFFGSVLYVWMWVCYGCSIIFYGSVLSRKKTNGLDFNDGRTRA